MQATEPSPRAGPADALAHWLRLELTPGVGGTSVRDLIDRFATPHAVLAASVDELAGVISRNKARTLHAPPSAELAAAIDAALAWAQMPGHAIIPMDDARYPATLRQLSDRPLLLYCIGRTELLANQCLAMVGSRNATQQGLINARAFAQALSEAGLTIVSGLAAGIDAAAHEGGLAGAGATIAVIGTGADRIYPARNRALAHAIAAKGCIVSEYSLGTPPASANFPRRNRIISGLSRGVLVVEAAAGSGSLITARVGNEQGRDIFAIPGSIHSPLAKGCHYLIKEGAKLVECAWDVLVELHLEQGAVAGPLFGHGTQGHDELLDAMGYGPVDGDTLAALPGMGPAALATRLLALEMCGKIERLPGGLFQRINR
ncbi:DNA-processing protein DprA [Massilia sp. PAMC28688]|uniref:DNA-processing protein DprA n=1 Tax=Massilia sp. PAMC28688 TaxID=2861283 RepID=UPI001C633BB1|nr:DNA-processing protein DprA [Massilia sp. PAMC28688]QYF94526.1 DNA-processing protein DprA [Massilia sp. PAMC28688]